MPENYDVSTSSVSASVHSEKTSYSATTKQPEKIVIILDDWKDCIEDKYVCIPPERGIKYDLKHLAVLLEGYPVSLSYSEVGILEVSKEYAPANLTRSTFRKSQPQQQPIQTIKQTIKGNPLHHFAPNKPSYRGLPSLSKPTPPGSLLSEELRPDTNSPIFIFHDLFRSQTEWQAFAADLAALLWRRVIIVDLRNHGTSPFATSICGIGEFLADFKNLFKELNLKSSKFTLIGHRISGWCVMIYALLYPYKVRNIILIESNPTDNPYLASVVAKAEIALLRVQPPPRGRPLPKLKLKVSEFLQSQVTNVQVRTYIVQNIVVNDVIGRAEKWSSKKSEIITSLNSFTKFPEFLKSHCFDKPVLFVASSGSKILRSEHEHAISKIFPQAKFIYYEKLTKNPHVELFDDFLVIVRDFLINDKL